MLETADTLHHTLATWLIEEELLLRDTADQVAPAALAERLARWQARLLVYEQLERALKETTATRPHNDRRQELAASGLLLAS
jgi:hypothetical protein